MELELQDMMSRETTGQDQMILMFQLTPLMEEKLSSQIRKRTRIYNMMAKEDQALTMQNTPTTPQYFHLVLDSIQVLEIKIT